MKVLLTPQLNYFDVLTYTFDGLKITANLNGQEDVFDFTGMSEGVLERDSVETILSVNPLVDAKIENGVLYVTLLNYVNENAKEDELFPQWKDV